MSASATKRATPATPAGHGSSRTRTPMSTAVAIETSVVYAEMTTTRPCLKPRFWKYGCEAVRRMPASAKPSAAAAPSPDATPATCSPHAIAALPAPITRPAWQPVASSSVDGRGSRSAAAWSAASATGTARSVSSAELQPAEVDALRGLGRQRQREEERAAEADADGGPLERGERLLEVEVREEREQHDPVAEDRLRHRDRQDRQRRQPEERARHVDADAAHPRERGDVLREHVLRERERREAAHRLLLQALAHHRDLREEREHEPYD